MSAIAGIYNINDEPVSIDYVNGVMGALKKYPANDVQIWKKKNIFLGCHAQWITPESLGEQLPYYDPERQLVLTADAVIDNRDELFKQLQVPYELRKSMTDGKLILLAYERWKEQCPKYLLGDFAFMIWDINRKQLFGARDFSGTRTLYYYHGINRFAFCTIMKPLMSLPFINKKLSEGWISEFLAIPVTADSVTPSQTVYQDISQIPPGHSITVTNYSLKVNRYFTFNTNSKLLIKTNQEYEEAFIDVIQKAVKSRLRTYRHVGSHLSGGLDSGTIASIAAKKLRSENKELHTYSYVPVKDFVDWTPRSKIANEKEYIQSIVDYVGNINGHYLDFNGKSPFTEIDDWLDVMEMPYKFYENSFWIKGIYEKASQQDIGILLNGQRGNWTISWGHGSDYYALLLKKLKLIQLYVEIQKYSRNLGTTSSRIMPIVFKKAFPFLRSSGSSKSENTIPILINPSFASRTGVYEKLLDHGIDPTGKPSSSVFKVRKHQFEEPCYWNLNGTIGTKLSLRHNVWERDPTNDLRVVEFCLSVPEGQFVQNGLDRSLIRRATVSYLPENIRLNMRRRGIQGADGLHRMLPLWKDFINEAESLIANSYIAEYLNMSVLESAFTEVKHNPSPSMVFSHSFRLLMKSIIFTRFTNQFT